MRSRYSDLKRFVVAQGINLFGVADIRKVRNDFHIAPKIIKGLDRAVCLGARLSSSILGEIEGAPTRLYFHHYRTVNAFLDQAALKVCNYIQARGYKALPVPASVILDWENQKGHLSHRQIGALAGLGWVGRSNLLVNPKIGAQFRLATILTDMPLKADKPIKDGCGTCQLCVQACPAGAIKEDRVDYEFNKCFDKLKEFQKQKLVDQYVCGVCVNACKGAAQ
jgi:epoxyqueuosine reductase QueG